MVFEPIQSMIKKQIRPALIIFLLLSVLLGILYPLIITGIAQIVFPVQANGNLIMQDGKVAGSALIGQPFTSPKYFWGRPSATSLVPYNAGTSSGSNLGPSNPALADAVKARVDALRAADPANTQQIPVDLVTASGSGLDPDISVAAAYYQVPRVARERNLSEQDVLTLVSQYAEPRQFWIFGEPHINVLRLNLALDDLSASPGSPAAGQQPDNLPQQSSDRRLAEWAVLVLFFGIFVVTVVPLGRFMWRVFTGQRNILSPVIEPIERWLLTT
jgi:K+-transporting ATPase KdpC subunit